MAIANFIRSALHSLSATRLLGKLIHVSAFPTLGGMPYPGMPPGTYLVDSIVLHDSGLTEVGLSDPVTRDHLQFFYLEDLDWHRAKGRAARTLSSMPAF